MEPTIQPAFMPGCVSCINCAELGAITIYGFAAFLAGLLCYR
jgi:hypothetical protein